MLIESTGNRLVKTAGLLRSSHTRQKQGLVLVEGRKAVYDALRAGAESEFALVRAGFGGDPSNSGVLEELGRREVSIHPVTPPVFDKISATERSQGIVLVAKEPHAEFSTLLQQGDTRPVVVLEALQDPGNLGATLRSAAALGFRGALLTRGTTDPFGPKVVRAAAATVFRFPVVRTGQDARPILERLAEAGFVNIAAAPGGEPPEVALRAGDGPVALVIGSEGRGLSGDALDVVRRRVWIPIEPGVESLNAGVAFGILGYVLSRQLRGASRTE